MASIRFKLTAALRHSPCRHVTSKAILASGAGLGLTGIAFNSVHGTVSCETSGVDTRSAIRTFLSSADGQLMIERMVMEKIKTLCDEEKSKLHRWACDEAGKAISAKVPDIKSRAQNEVENFGGQEALLSEVTRKAVAEMRESAKQESHKIWCSTQKWAEAEAHQRIDADFQKTISNDPKIQRIIGEHIANVRLTLIQEVEREVREIAEEDRFHKVNSALLAVLQRKEQELLTSNSKNNSHIESQTRLKTYQSLGKLENVLDSSVDRRTVWARREAMFGQFLGGVACLGVAALVGGQYIGLHIRK